MSASRNLLLQAIRDLQSRNHILKIMRSRCRSCAMCVILDKQQRQLQSLEWEGRQLAIQRGLEPPDFPKRTRFPSVVRSCGSDPRLAQEWTRRNRESLAWYRRELHRCQRVDPVSILCQKSMDFCIRAIAQTEPFL